LDITAKPFIAPSRVIPAARLYARENLLSHLDLLSGAFAAYGLPMALTPDLRGYGESEVKSDNVTLDIMQHFYLVFETQNGFAI
jgi:hypothetical protein